MAVPALMSRVGYNMSDPAREMFKIKFLADFAVNDCHCQTPADVVSMLAKLGRSGTSLRGHSMLDNLYSAAQRSRAYSAMREAHS